MQRIKDYMTTHGIVFNRAQLASEER